MLTVVAHDEAADWREDLVQALRSAWKDPTVRVGAVERFGSGHSGFTFLVGVSGERPPERFVLRLSPKGARIAGPADIGRQGRIMSALRSAGLPVPEIVAADSRPLVGGRSYALMRRVDGVDFEEANGRSGPRRVAQLAVEFLHGMQALAPSATGIGDEVPTTLVGELERWAALISRAPEPLRSDAAELHDALAREMPTARGPRLVHGDYHYGNMLFGVDRLAAVLDWEIAALGDPLLDLGCLAVASLRRRYLPEPNPTGGLTVSPSELAELFGIDESEIVWPTAFTCYKYAAILGYNFSLHLSGKRPDPIYPQLTGTMSGLVVDGVRFLRTGTVTW